MHLIASIQVQHHTFKNDYSQVNIYHHADSALQCLARALGCHALGCCGGNITRWKLPQRFLYVLSQIFQIFLFQWILCQ